MEIVHQSGLDLLDLGLVNVLLAAGAVQRHQVSGRLSLEMNFNASPAHRL
jgi:hypothetical protein